MKKLIKKVLSPVRFIYYWSRNVLNLVDPEEKIIKDSENYWNDQSKKVLKQYSHWRGQGVFVDDLRWLSIGLEHLEMYQQFARLANCNQTLTRVVEWGCGGGANAIHFAKIAQEYYGIDISKDSLDECQKQLSTEGLTNFKPILIEALKPEAVCDLISESCDLFLSTYVFELIPSQEYGNKILKIAYQLLKENGIALIQIKYSTQSPYTLSKKWNYNENLTSMTTYPIEQFWSLSEECGFKPQAIKLVPKQPLVDDERYAYFCLLK
jgi:ubiquinone/menaquinone biosynthesis C-methylase UbiE